MTKFTLFGKNNLRVFHISFLEFSDQSCITKYFRYGTIVGMISALGQRLLISYDWSHTAIAYSLGVIGGHSIAIMTGVISFYEVIEIGICLTTAGASVIAIFYFIKNPQLLMRQ